ncbi:MAG: hypothetical protein ACLSH6_08110 [Limosilactobacillus pontis]
MSGWTRLTARLIVKDLQQFAPGQVLGQYISSLYFYGVVVQGPTTLATFRWISCAS